MRDRTNTHAGRVEDALASAFDDPSVWRVTDHNGRLKITAWANERDSEGSDR